MCWSVLQCDASTVHAMRCDAMQLIEASGIRMSDPRLKECLSALSSVQRAWDYSRSPAGVVLDRRTFKQCVSANICLLSLIFHNDFLVRLFPSLTHSRLPALPDITGPTRPASPVSSPRFTRPPRARSHGLGPSAATVTPLPFPFNIICACSKHNAPLSAQSSFSACRSPSSRSSRTTLSVSTSSARRTARAPYVSQSQTHTVHLWNHISKCSRDVYCWILDCCIFDVQYVLLDFKRLSVALKAISCAYWPAEDTRDLQNNTAYRCVCCDTRFRFVVFFSL